MQRALTILAVLFGVCYAIALALWATDSYGLVSSASDPIQASYLGALGTPWNRLGGGQVLAVGAPLINLGILLALRGLTRS